MNDALLPLVRRRAASVLWPHAVMLAVAAVALVACSGSAAAPPSASNPFPAGTKPVIFNVDSVNGAFFYNGIRPSSIDLTLEDQSPGSNVAAGLMWTSWPAGPGGIVAASATVTGAGKIKTTAQPVTVTLSDPSNGKPSFWQTLTERVHGQQPTVYHFYGKWALKASGGQQMP
jgi:hypothetical protein